MSQFELKQLIKLQPGITYSELVNKIRLGNSSVSHSLKQLIKYNEVKKTKIKSDKGMGHVWVSSYEVIRD